MNNSQLIERMDLVRDLCASTLSVRSKNDIRIRQPLPNLDVVYTGDKFDFLTEYYEFVDIIKDECNVKHVTLINDKFKITL